MSIRSRLLGFAGLLAGAALAQDNADQADSAVTFNPVKTGIAVTANQTITVDIP